MLATLASSIVVALVKWFGLEWMEKKEIEQMLRDSWNAGRATGIAEEAKRHEKDILDAPPITTPQEAADELNRLMASSTPTKDTRSDLLNGLYRVKS